MDDRIASTSKTAFICPHCGAFTSQHWFSLLARELDEKSPLPYFPNESDKSKIITNTQFSESDKEPLVEWINLVLSEEVALCKITSLYADKDVVNLNISKCYSCRKFAVWVHQKLVYPPTQYQLLPNKDLPDEIKKDFNEARSIVDLSPRGAAALLRLCIQKLCIYLGEKGKSIDDDIGALVKKGLSPVLQKSLDVVRVVGNSAVHPGELNLDDDSEIAKALFHLVNSIGDQMISHPNEVDRLYARLPEEKKKRIEFRDNK